MRQESSDLENLEQRTHTHALISGSGYAQPNLQNAEWPKLDSTPICSSGNADLDFGRKVQTRAKAFDLGTESQRILNTEFANSGSRASLHIMETKLMRPANIHTQFIPDLVHIFFLHPDKGKSLAGCDFNNRYLVFPGNPGKRF